MHMNAWSMPADGFCTTEWDRRTGKTSDSAGCIMYLAETRGRDEDGHALFVSFMRVSGPNSRAYLGRYLVWTDLVVNLSSSPVVIIVGRVIVAPKRRCPETAAPLWSGRRQRAKLAEALPRGYTHTGDDAADTSAGGEKNNKIQHQGWCAKAPSGLTPRRALFPTRSSEKTAFGQPEPVLGAHLPFT